MHIKYVYTFTYTYITRCYVAECQKNFEEIRLHAGIIRPGKDFCVKVSDNRQGHVMNLMSGSKKATFMDAKYYFLYLIKLLQNVSY